VRSGAAAGHVGYFHETAFYGSDDELVDIVAPFLREGVAHGEPTVVACGPRNTALLERVVDPSVVRFLPGADQYARPGPTIRTYRAMFRELLSGGAAQIRVVGDVPHPGVGTDWHAWLRYEAVVNEAYDDVPLWGLCPYDTRTTPDHVLEDVRRTHPHIADGHGHHERNADFLDPVRYLAEHPDVEEPLRAPPGSTVLLDPDSRGLRHHVRELLGPALEPDRLSDLLVAASEVVTNARLHGGPPVRAWLWAGADEVVVAVADAGPGPTDRRAGLLPPAPDRSDGRGLWIANQLCDDVRTSWADGFTVELRFRTRAAATAA
jgi:anti-sigma regulatory factor (Ser/Thr protein kinase)